MIEWRGELLAAALARELEPRVTRFRELAGRRPCLALVSADDPESRRFLELKRQRFDAAGLDVRARVLGSSASGVELRRELEALNADGTVDGIFLQFPLPGAVDAREAADLIAPQKDVDAVGSISLGRLVAGTAIHLPATAAAILRLLEDELGELQGRTLVLAGTPGPGEQCIVLLALARGGTACIIPPGDPALPDAAAGADAIVITAELPPGEALRHVRNGAVLIDAGYACPPRPAGWLPARALEHLGTYLPQHRNVGPLTVALLMQATVRAAFLRRD